MGTVYLAEAPDGTRVALKVLHPHLHATAGFFERFRREGSVGRRIQHRNVVRTLDVGVGDVGGESRHFLVMEHVAGRTLREILDELGPLPEALCVHIAREAACGLAAIHEAGVVHRDLKPENVIVTSGDEEGDDGSVDHGRPVTAEHVVKLMDLGVARLVKESVRLSRTGAFVGSVHYAAPEQFRDIGGDVDGRADLYALGLVLYEIASGVQPFEAKGVARVLGKILHEEPRRLGELSPQVSPFFEEVVHTLIRKDRDDRFASAADLIAVLDDAEESAWWSERARAVRAETARPLRRIRIPRETGIHGREKELELLEDRFARAASGRGQVVLVEGEAGVGKSRLADGLVERLERRGEELHFLFGSYLPAGAATALGALSTAFREHLGEGGAAEHLRRTPRLVPGFEAILRGEPPPPGSPALSKDTVITCFVTVVQALATERPTVLLVEDLHFAPEDARDVFTSLALAAAESRVLVIATTRPGLPPDWMAHLSRMEHAETLPLDRLRPKDLALLLRDCFRSERLAEELGYRVALMSDGNPFFVFEIVRALREGGLIEQRPDGTWVSTGAIDDIRIPSSVRDLVNARVAELDDDDRYLLDVAACEGFEFDASLVGDAIGIPRIPALQRCARIEKRYRLVRASGRRFVFDHHQVQEALREALPLPLREEYHAALARALEARLGADERDPEELAGADCVRLCEHHLSGANGPHARRYLEPALEHLAAGHLQAPAVSLAQRMLAVPGVLTGKARAEILLQLAGAYRPLDMLGRREEQEAAAREAARLADATGDRPLRSRAAFVLGMALWRRARHEEAEASFRRARRLSEAVRLHERDLALSREAGDRRGEARATGNIGRVSLQQGRLRVARTHAERYLEMCREIGNEEGEALAEGTLGGILFSQGQFDEARTHYERALALCRDQGDRQGEGRAESGLGNVCAARGRIVEARTHLERARELARETGHPRNEAAATMNLGVVLQEQARFEPARAHFERALALHEAIGNRPSVAIAQHNLGGVLREMGRTEAADERFGAALAACEELGIHGLHVATLLALGDLRVAQGDVEAARELLRNALRMARERDYRSDETLALCALAALPGGDVPAATAALRTNDPLLESSARIESRFLLWKAAGDRAYLAEAKQLLDASLDLVPAESRSDVRERVRLHREILSAWRREGRPSVTT
jgi:tetratricopeptide (TPR) repeat protein